MGKRYFGGYEKEKEDLKIPTGSGEKRLRWVTERKNRILVEKNKKKDEEA
ncbi:MAG: hypothetical protein K6G22_02900 [Lachnospiraceae bacterium]|nr:hypothetical protein [Lachnospiraceae bacterium]